MDNLWVIEYILIKSFDRSITKMCLVITDYCARCVKARKDVFFQKLHDNFVVVSFTWNNFNPSRNVIDDENNINISEKVRKRSHKVNFSYIKIFDHKDKVKGIIFCQETFLRN